MIDDCLKSDNFHIFIFFHHACKFTKNLIHFSFPALRINFFNYWQASQEEGKPRDSQSIRYISPLNFACTDDLGRVKKPKIQCGVYLLFCVL